MPPAQPKSKVSSVPLKPKPPISPRGLGVSVFPFDFKVKCLILTIISFAFYFNTLQNGYLLDDNLAIVSNDYVQEGISGIPSILTQDSYISWMKKSGMYKHKLSAGRYRPLSIVVFAIEHTIFGESTFMRHLMNILFFCALLITMLWFLDKSLHFGTPVVPHLGAKSGAGGDMAFLAVLLFAINPIHIEVVANIKSLDEILSLLFILLTFIFSLRYFNQKKILDLVIGLVCYLLSLLSKEYGIMLFILLPVLLYITGNKKPVGAVVSSLPFYGMFIVYMLLRINAVGAPAHQVNNDVAINPYLYATGSQAIASKLFVIGKYLYMLFIPYPLSYNYDYAQVPYHNFSDISVLASILIYLTIGVWAIWLVYKKNILAFPVLLFLLNIALVSNLFTDISSLMGERLIFQASFGFAAILSYGIFESLKKMQGNSKRIIIYTAAGILIVIFGIETLKRNPVWKSFEILTTTDVNTVPNSIIANDYAAMSYLFLASQQKDSIQSGVLIRKAIQCANKSTHILSRYFNGYYKLGTAYDMLKMPDSAIYYMEIAKSINPYDSALKTNLARIYVLNGFRLGNSGNIRGAISFLWKGIGETPGNPDIWYNLGVTYFNSHNYDSARFAWSKTITLKPGYPGAVNGLQALPSR